MYQKNKPRPFVSLIFNIRFQFHSFHTYFKCKIALNKCNDTFLNTFSKNLSKYEKNVDTYSWAGSSAYSCSNISFLVGKKSC